MENPLECKYIQMNVILKISYCDTDYVTYKKCIKKWVKFRKENTTGSDQSSCFSPNQKIFNFLDMSKKSCLLDSLFFQRQNETGFFFFFENKTCPNSRPEVSRIRPILFIDPCPLVYQVLNKEKLHLSLMPYIVQ